MKAYKAFNHDLSCRGFKYAIGQTYIHGGAVRLCDSGFHACEAPIDVLGYYPPTARFAEVTLGGVSDKTQDDSKRAAGEITIDRELSLGELIAAQVAYVRAIGGGEIAVGNGSTAASSGDGSKAASSGDYSKAASVGYRSTAASAGERTIAMVAGLHGQAKAGPHGAFALPWLDGDQVCIAVGTVGRDGIKPDTWYRAGDQGQLIEVKE